MSETILLVDLGNTSVKLALFRKGRVTRMVRMETRAGKSPPVAALKRYLGPLRPSGAAFSSVVPSLDKAWLKMLRNSCGSSVLHVNCRHDLGFSLDYPRPETIGTDRLATCAGAAARYGVPAVVLDFGTALKGDVLHARRGFIGGIIAPGRNLMLDYLAERAEKLPHLTYRKLVKPLGRSTREAMLLGAGWGFEGMVREIAARLSAATGHPHPVLCATGGGGADTLKGLKLPMKYDQDLTLYGLARIYELNRPE